MALTDFGAVTPAKKKVWSLEIWRQGRDESFWFSNGFVGKSEDMNKPIHRITELTKTERGESCVMQLVAELTGDGVSGDDELEGNEESLVNDTQEVKIDQLRNGVKSKGRMSEQVTVIRFRALAKQKLTFWLPDKIDEMMHLCAAGRSFTLKPDGTNRGASALTSLAYAADVTAASTNRIRYAGGATSEASITAADTVSWDYLVEANAYAKRKKLKPIREGGKPYFAVVLSTEQCRDLKKDPDYRAAVQNAGPRGSKNPLFTGANAIVDGMMIYDHNKVFNTLGKTGGTKWGAGGAVDGAQGLLLGAQAMGFASIGKPNWEESDTRDYKAKQGVAYDQIFGMLKPQFDSPVSGEGVEDFGVISLKTAAAQS